jgi:TctA family transporter
VLLSCGAVILYSAFSLATKRPWDRAGFILNTAFVGIYDLQVLAGILLLFLAPYYPALIGHIVTMILGAVAIHIASAKNKRRESPGYLLPLIGAVLGLIAIIAGVAAIQRDLVSY